MKRSPLKRTTGLRRSSRLNRVSPKRRKQLADYTKLRREFLETHMRCMVGDCTNLAEEIHHMGYRNGARLNDVSKFLATCKQHHNAIHRNPAWARSHGFLV